MADKSTSVKISEANVEIYREWSREAGSNMNALMNRVLGDAALHYLAGVKVGIRQMSEDKKKGG